MSADASFHMTPEEFRRWGYAVVDWVADYQRRVESLPVLSRVQPGQIRASLPAEPPQRGEPFDAILADVEKLILPGITHWQSPNFFAFFPANNSGPSILGELLSAGLGVQGMLWATSPACTELETHVLDWMADDARPAGEVQVGRSRRRRRFRTPPPAACCAPCWPRANGPPASSPMSAAATGGWWPTPPPRRIRRWRRR